MITVTLYTRNDCPECQQAVDDLNSLQEEVPHQLVQVNVDEDRALEEKLGRRVPLVMIGPFTLRSPFTRQDLLIMLSAARDRINQMERVDQEAYARRLEQGHSMATSDRVTHFLAHHWLALANVLLLIYVGLPFLAPVLLKVGSPLPAQVIYKMYSPLCHQLAFRSWFLFGEQAYYPRALAGIDGVVTYESLVNTSEADIVQARNFVGNEVVGYKVALCQRDVAIYAFMLLFGVFYAVSGRKLRSLPWYVWVLLGMGPIALDGFSQLPSLASGLPGWLPVRESSPLLRMVTGGLFGWVTAWYLFPMLEDTAVETRRLFQRKKAVVEQSVPQQKG
jgi:uncharacterized membrane protein/glutaredoxin